MSDKIFKTDGTFKPGMTFSQLQREVNEWSRRNFPNDRTPSNPFEGMVEELGELAHARLKARQGIRGTKEEHEAAEKDAIGDILIYMADYCAERGFCLQKIIEETWAQVRQRNWTANAKTGVASA